jgi:hypothetical protein
MLGVYPISVHTFFVSKVSSFGEKNQLMPLPGWFQGFQEPIDVFILSYFFANVNMS